MDQLLVLAQAYRGWNRKELAKALGRDPTKVIPGTGNPKLDLVISLSRILDWPVGEVAELLWVGHAPEDEGSNGQGFEDLQRQAKEAHRAGEFEKAIDLALEAYAVAATAEQRALAAHIEAGGWDGLGRYLNVRAAAQKGLAETGISLGLRHLLQSILAGAYYTLWNLDEARAMAKELIDWFREDPPSTIEDRFAHAHAYYVRGHAYRRLIRRQPDQAQLWARLAKEDLAVSATLYRELADQFEIDAYRGIANTCEGGIMAVEVTLGERDALEVLEAISNGLDAVIEPEQCPAGDWLESYGWWCIFGCDVALGHVDDEILVQRYMAVFTNKAEEISDRLGNWAMRERVLTMEYARRKRLDEHQMLKLSDWAIDREDVREIVGTMGRFPRFRDDGLKILQTARLVGYN